MNDDIIVAVATSRLEAAISIIRLSGKDVIAFVQQFFTGKIINKESHTITYGYIKDNGEKIDEVLVNIYRGKRTFTGEEMVEINCHGGVYITNKVVDLCLHHGARLAERGEFSKRAFLNGRIDLSQAEAISDIITAKNSYASSLALKGIQGSISHFIKDLKEELIQIITQIEVNIDYPEYEDVEELTADKLLPMSTSLIEKMNKIIEDSKNIKLLKEGIQTAIIGKPNVGKSSIVNRLLGENRVIVSNIAGTTRDAIDTEIVHDGKEYIFIDTAGLRRKNKIKEELERYSIIRTVSAVERADVVLMVIDATEGVTEQDAKIAGIAHERGKGVIIVVNKWDAIEKNDKTMKEYEGKIRQVLSYMPYAEIMYVSALTGQRLPKLYDMIDMVIENQTLRIATGVLNEIMTEAVAMQQPPSDKGKRLKLYYIAQVAVKPPTFVIFVNDKELMHFSYTRYLENKIREAFGFRGTSLKFFIRERKEKDQ